MGDGLEILFDTLPTSRKLANLRSNPAVAFVIGGWTPGERRSVQYEGVADEPSEPQLTRFKTVHFGRSAASRGAGGWAEVVYVRVRPTWIRFADFSHHPPLAVEFGAAELGRVAERTRRSSR